MKTYELGTCPACGAGGARLLVDADGVRAQVERLWRFQLRRRKPAVPPEQLYDRAFFSQDPPLQISECAECGTVYRNPRETAVELIETYTEEDADPSVFEGLFETQRKTYARQADLLTELAGRPGRGLEVGSYVGAFLAAARERGWQFDGVDVSAAANAFAGAHGFTVARGSIDDAPTDVPYDAVAFWNCFDQLPHPRSALIAARTRLRPGGVLAIRVPNGGFYARLVRSHLPAPVRTLLLAHNNLLAFPYRNGFTPSSLEQLLSKTGFDLVRMRGDALVPTWDQWTRPWAVWEERAVKRLLRAWPLNALAPWFEVYAT